MAARAEARAEGDWESLSGMTSSTEEEMIDQDALQRFVEEKGPTIGTEQFFVEVREKRMKTAMKVLGFGQGHYHKYVKRLPSEIHGVRIKGYLLAKPYLHKISTEKGTYLPIEMAEQLIDPERPFRDSSRVNEAMKEILVPATIHEYQKNGEIRSWDDKDESMAVPEEGHMEVYVNIDMDEVMKGPKKKGCLMLSNYNGRSIVVLPSGSVYTPTLNPATLLAGFSWKRMDIKEMAYQVGERIDSRVEAMKEAENRRLHEKVHLLEEKVRELESRGAEGERPRAIVPEIEEAIVDEYAIYNLKDSADAKLIRDKGRAMNLPIVTKSIPLWGKRSEHPAEDWLDMAIPRAKAAGVSMDVMHHVLLSRLDTDVSPDMYALESHGMMESISDFIRLFKEKFMVLSTPVQKLRELQRAQMTTDQVARLQFNEFGNSLVKKAHKAYEGLRLKRESWKVLDSVVVTMAFLNGIPKDIASEIVKEGKTEMDEMIFLASHLSKIKRDFSSHSSVLMVTQETKDGGKEKQGEASKAGASGQRRRYWKPNTSQRDAMCRLCRDSDKPPKDGKCDHCRNCFKPGHGKKDCPQKEPTQFDEAKKALKKKKE